MSKQIKYGENMLEKNFWARTAMIWGASTGLVVLLTLLAALVDYIGGGAIALVTICVLVAVIEIPFITAVINNNELVAMINTPANIVAGFVMAAILGFVFIILLPFLINDVIQKSRKTIYTEVYGPVEPVHHGYESFYRLPECVATRVGTELQTSYFHTHQN
jgi:hypothetical protein